VFRPAMRSLLDTLDDVDRRDFVRRSTRRSFRAGDKVFWQDDPGDSVHLVARGSFVASVATPLNQTVVVSVFRRSDVFGELAVIGAEPRRNATVSALERSETLSMDAEQFEEWRKRSPQIDRALVRALALRLDEMTQQMLEALYVPIDQRVVRRILALHEAIGPRATDDWLHIRQEEFAAYCGVTRATVNRVLRKLSEVGLVELGRGRLRVTDRVRLLEMVD